MFTKCLTLAVSAIAAFSILGVTTPDPFAQEASSVVLDETLLEGLPVAESWPGPRWSLDCSERRNRPTGGCLLRSGGWRALENG